MSVSTFVNGLPATQLRGLAWLSLSETGNIVSTAGTTDSGGGWTSGTATSGTAIPCRIDPLSGAETLVGGRIDERSTHSLTVPSETGLTSKQQFSISGRGTYEVTAERDRTATLLQVFEVVKRD